MLGILYLLVYLAKIRYLCGRLIGLRLIVSPLILGFQQLAASKP